MKYKGIFLGVILFGVGVVEGLSFPEDFMVEGKPVNAAYVVDLLMEGEVGDTRRALSEVRVEEDALECDWMINWSREDVFHEDEGLVRSCLRGEWGENGEVFGDTKVWDEYTCEGSYQEKYLVHGLHHTSGTSGWYQFLGVMGRRGEAIVNLGLIASGDRGCGGFIRVHSIEDGVLRYSQGHGPNYVIKLLSGRELGVHDVPVGGIGASLIYEVDLNKDDCESKLVGVDLWGVDHNLFDEDELGQFAIVMNCYNRVLAEYLNADRGVLSVEEGREFAQEVMSLIERRG